jgi:hypothetical protein
MGYSYPSAVKPISIMQLSKNFEGETASTACTVLLPTTHKLKIELKSVRHSQTIFNCGNQMQV